MTLEEAIKILSDSANAGMTTFDDKYKKAQKLGIEALKRTRDNRIGLAALIKALLPGETKE